MFDLDAYFSRIGYAGPRQPTLAVLHAICARQAAAVVYENLDPLFGIAPRLDTQALQDKLLAQRRGGYCFELNLLLRSALLGLDMRVACLAARVTWNAPPGAPPRPRTHMLLRVEVTDSPGDAWFVDLGFGGQLFGSPLLFAPGAVQSTPFGAYRIGSDGGDCTVETEGEGGWQALYRFAQEEQLPTDFEPANWFTATHPASIFRHNLLMQALTPRQRVGLFNDRLMVRRPGEKTEMRRIASAGELERVFEREFGFVPPRPAAEIFARIPQGLDHFVVP